MDAVRVGWGTIESDTVPAKLLILVIMIVENPGLPAKMVSDTGLAEMPKTGGLTTTVIGVPRVVEPIAAVTVRV